MTPRLDVVIVNWNAGPLLRDCVESLSGADDGRRVLNVVVVDNGSRDGSADALPAGAMPLTVVRNAENRGFAAACNQGAAAGRAPYILFLNPDTRVSRPAIDGALAFMEDEANREVGICGIQLRDESGEISRSCSRHPTPGRMLASLVALDRLLPGLVAPHAMSEWDHAESRDVDQVIGAFFLVRRPLFVQLGGFDERFFVYYEEVDLAYRASRAGARVHYLAAVSAYHAGGGTTNAVRAFRQFLVTQSRILYAFKHFNPVAARLHALGSLVAEPVVRALYFAAQGDARSVRETLAATTRLWTGAGSLLRGHEAGGTRPAPATPVVAVRQ